MDNLCISCGESVPEGRQVCRECETKAENKPKRNIDRLREMSTEELAHLIARCDCCAYKRPVGCEAGKCADGVLKWLEKEVDG